MAAIFATTRMTAAPINTTALVAGGISVAPTRAATKEVHWGVVNEVPNAATNEALAKKKKTRTEKSTMKQEYGIRNENRTEIWSSSSNPVVKKHYYITVTHV